MSKVILPLISDFYISGYETEMSMIGLQSHPTIAADSVQSTENEQEFQAIIGSDDDVLVYT